MESTTGVSFVCKILTPDESHFPSLFASGKTVPVMYQRIYTLENLSQGLAAIERRETWGKAIVRIRDEPNAKL